MFISGSDFNETSQIVLHKIFGDACFRSLQEPNLELSIMDGYLEIRFEDQIQLFVSDRTSRHNPDLLERVIRANANADDGFTLKLARSERMIVKMIDLSIENVEDIKDFGNIEDIKTFPGIKATWRLLSPGIQNIRSVSSIMLLERNHENQGRTMRSLSCNEILKEVKHDTKTNLTSSNV